MNVHQDNGKTQQEVQRNHDLPRKIDMTIPCAENKDH